MFVCMNRNIAYDLYKIIVEMRPEWAEKKISEDETALTDKEKKRTEAHRENQAGDDSQQRR